MMIKLIASDLDETLLGPGSRVVEGKSAGY